MTCAETNGSGRMTTPRDMRSRFWCSEHAACIRLNELFRTVAFFLDFECRAKNYNCCKRICIDSYYIDANRLSRECVSSQTIQNWQCYSWVQCCSVHTVLGPSGGHDHYLQYCTSVSCVGAHRRFGECRKIISVNLKYSDEPCSNVTGRVRCRVAAYPCLSQIWRDQVLCFT